MATPSKDFREYPVRPIAVGLFKDLHPSLIPPGGWQIVDGFHFLNNAILTYAGWTDFYGQVLDSIVKYGFDWQLFDGTHRFIVATTAKIYVFNTGTNVFDIKKAGFATAIVDRWQSCILNNKLYLTNNDAVIQVYDGAAVINLAGDADQPKCRFMVSFVNRLLVADTFEGASNFHQRVRWSDINDPFTWIPSDINEAGFLDIDQEGDKITGLAVQDQNRCVVYKENSIYLLTYVGFPYIMTVQQIAHNEGLLAPYSLVSFKDQHFFLGNTDFYQLSGTQIKGLGVGRIRDSFYALVDRNKLDEIFGFAHPDFPEIWWIYPTRNDVTAAIIYNYDNDVWSERGSFPMTMMAAFVNQTGVTWADPSMSIPWTASVLTWEQMALTNEFYIIGGDSTGAIFQHGTVLDTPDGPISKTLRTGDIELKTSREKFFRKLRLGLEPTVTLTPGATAVTVFGRDTFVGNQTITFTSNFNAFPTVDFRAKVKILGFQIDTTDSFNLIEYSLWAKLGSNR